MVQDLPLLVDGNSSGQDISNYRTDGNSKLFLRISFVAYFLNLFSPSKCLSKIA
jgi:hypothetical protein